MTFPWVCGKHALFKTNKIHDLIEVFPRFSNFYSDNSYFLKSQNTFFWPNRNRKLSSIIEWKYSQLLIWLIFYEFIRMLSFLELMHYSRHLLSNETSLFCENNRCGSNFFAVSTERFASDHRYHGVGKVWQSTTQTRQKILSRFSIQNNFRAQLWIGNTDTRSWKRSESTQRCFAANGWQKHFGDQRTERYPKLLPWSHSRPQLWIGNTDNRSWKRSESAQRCFATDGWQKHFGRRENFSPEVVPGLSCGSVIPITVRENDPIHNWGLPLPIHNWGLEWLHGRSLRERPVLRPPKWFCQGITFVNFLMVFTNGFWNYRSTT
jgi:hypothetical protein